MKQEDPKEESEEAENNKKKESVFQGYIKDRVYKKNKNFLMLVVGATGSGKSYSALRLAEMLDPTFDISRCCFKAKEFLMKVRELQKHAEETGEEIKGKVVMWDELGCEHDAKRFMSISNRIVNYFFQTSRYLNLIVIMTVPLLSFVDSSTRRLCHCIAEMQSINSKTKTSTLRVKFLQVNPITSKEYPKKLRYKKNNKTYALSKIKVGLPSPELKEKYEKKKREYGDWLYEDSIKRLDKDEVKDGKQLKPLTPMQEKVAKLLSKHGAKETAKKLGIALMSLYAHKNNIEKKGYRFKPIWKDKKVICYEIEGLNLN